MARRTIKTVDGQVFSGSSSRFENHRGYILFKVRLFETVRINKRTIVSDDINGLSVQAIMVLTIFLMMTLVIGFLLLNGRTQVSETQHNARVAANANVVGDVLPAVIGSTKSGYYYLPGCSEYERVKPEHKISFNNKQEAIIAGFKKYKKCPG